MRKTTTDLHKTAALSFYGKDGDLFFSLPCYGPDFMFMMLIMLIVEQKADAPKRRETDDYKYDSASDRELPAKNPGNNIKTEKPDRGPVEAADD